MNYTDEKLEKFYNNVMKDALSKRDKLLSEIEEKKKLTMQQKELLYLEEAYNFIQKAKRSINKKSNDSISKAIMESKKALFQKREQIISSVFENVYKNVLDFTNSEKYKEFLFNKISAALSFVSDGEKIIYINKSDEKFLDEINKTFCSEKIKALISDNDFIGGCIVKNIDKNIIVDETISEKLNEQKGLFVEKSGINIEWKAKDNYGK